MDKGRNGVSPDTEIRAATAGGGPKMTRRQFLARGAATLVGAGLLTGGYAWQGEPRWLEVTAVDISFRELPADFHGLKVVHFSDTHLGFNKNARDMARLAAHIKKEQPDLICFTGDIVDSFPSDLEDSVPILAGMNAPLGKFAILGNHDYKNTARLTELWKATGFTLLRNESALVKRGGAAIAVAGLEDMLHGKPDPVKALSGIPKGMFTLLLMHEPDYADQVDSYPFHLQLSGHSHGGQVRFPFVGATFTPYGSHKYIAGLYHTEKGMPVYVNRGFGETYMPFRLLCRPELTVFTLRKGE